MEQDIITAPNTVFTSWLIVVWESVLFQLFLFCWKAFRLRYRHEGQHPTVMHYL